MNQFSFFVGNGDNKHKIYEIKVTARVTQHAQSLNTINCTRLRQDH